MLFDSIRILDRVLVGYHLAGQAGKRQDILGPAALWIIAYTISTFILYQVHVNQYNRIFHFELGKKYQVNILEYKDLVSQS